MIDALYPAPEASHLGVRVEPMRGVKAKDATSRIPSENRTEKLSSRGQPRRSQRFGCGRAPYGETPTPSQSAEAESMEATIHRRGAAIARSPEAPIPVFAGRPGAPPPRELRGHLNPIGDGDAGPMDGRIGAPTRGGPGLAQHPRIAQANVIVSESQFSRRTSCGSATASPSTTRSRLIREYIKGEIEIARANGTLPPLSFHRTCVSPQPSAARLLVMPAPKKADISIGYSGGHRFDGSTNRMALRRRGGNTRYPLRIREIPAAVRFIWV